MDAVLGHELRKLNSHLPKQRRTLTELLRSKDTTIRAADGSSIILKKEDLEQLAKVVPAEYYDRLKLPILVVRRIELGKSVYTIEGDRIEEFAVRKILGLTNDDYYEMFKEKEPTFLYGPQIGELLSKFHSLIVIGFAIPKELSDYAPSRD